MGKHLTLYVPEEYLVSEDISASKIDLVEHFDLNEHDSLEQVLDSYPNRLEEDEPVIEVYDDEERTGKEKATHYGKEDIRDALI